MKRVFNSIDPLQKQFNRLEIEWDSIKQSISRSNRRNSTAAGDHSLLQMHETSPKELMALLQLQNENSPSIDYVRLKGRRLFEESDAGSDDYDTIVVGTHGGGCFDVDEQSEVSTEFSCKGFENYNDKGERFCLGSLRSGEAEKGVTAGMVKTSGGRGRGRGSVGRLMICLVVMLALAIVVFKCSGECEQILVPT